jgi:hypothetical protein
MTLPTKAAEIAAQLTKRQQRLLFGKDDIYKRRSEDASALVRLGIWKFRGESVDSETGDDAFDFDVTPLGQAVAECLGKSDGG